MELTFSAKNGDITRKKHPLQHVSCGEIIGKVWLVLHGGDMALLNASMTTEEARDLVAALQKGIAETEAANLPKANG